MRHYYFILIASFLIIGCGQPEPETYPSWYIKPPQSTSERLYSIAIDANETAAKSSAELLLRSEILKQVKKDFETPEHPIKHSITPKEYQASKKLLGFYASRIIFTDSKIEEVAKKPLDDEEKKEEKRPATTMVLISVDAQALFQNTQSTLNTKINKLQKEFQTAKSISALHAFVVLEQIQKQKYDIAFQAELLHVIDNSFSNTKYFKFLYEMTNLDAILKKEINISIISDANAISFVKPIKKALQDTGLQVSGMKMNAPRTYTLLITSRVKKDSIYGFNVARIQVQTRIKTKSKKLVAENTITFEGKSRYDNKDARKLALGQYTVQMQKQGIFSMLGIK